MSGCVMKCQHGLVFAPMPHLVREGKVGRDLARQTIAVLCDQCQYGKDEIAAQDAVMNQAAPTHEEAWKKKKLMTLERYYTATNGIDGIGLLWEYEAYCLAELKKTREPMKAYPNLAAELAGSMRVPQSERPRGPEHIEEWEEI